MWLETLEQQENLKAQENFWNRIFASPPAPLNLPTDYARPDYQTFTGGEVSFHIETPSMERITTFAKKKKVTIFSVLFCAFNILIYELTNQSDLTIGVPVSGRERFEMQDIVGLFLIRLR